MGQWVEKTLQEMTLEEKVGQLICGNTGRWPSEIKEMLALGHVGSIYLNRGDKPTRAPHLTAHFTNELQQTSKYPLLFSSGHEGLYFPVQGGTELPSAMALGATRSRTHAQTWARVMARECKAVGIFWVDAPVLDVNINPVNPIINIRSFGERPELVATMGSWVIETFKEESVLSTSKHFPGHGDTSVDSHIALPVVPFHRRRLDAVELYPYREAMPRGLSTVMTTHTIFPKVDPSGLPATLSRPCITGLLREGLGFDGIIITDGMAMQGLHKEYDVEQAAIMALQAGHDILLANSRVDPRITYNALLKAVKEGLVPISQVEASVRRILTAKELLGLHIDPFVDPQEAEAIVGSDEHKEAILQVGCDSITLLEDKGFPLTGSSSQEVLLIYTEDEEGPGYSLDLGAHICSPGEAIASYLRNYYAHVDHVMVYNGPTPEQREEALARADEADLVIFASFVPLACYKEGSGMIPTSQVKLARELRARSKHLSFLIYGPPYVLAQLPKADISLCAYSNTPPSIEGSVKVLCGSSPARGKLPVTISPEYPFGSGILS